MDKEKTKQIREEFEQLESPNARLIDKQMEIATQISRYLREQGITQTELADKADVYDSQISEILRGEGNPTLKTLVKLEEALDEDIIIAPSFHEKQMTRKGFANLSVREKAELNIGKIVSRAEIKHDRSWEISRSANPAKNEISEVEVYADQVDQENLVPSYS